MCLTFVTIVFSSNVDKCYFCNIIRYISASGLISTAINFRYKFVMLSITVQGHYLRT